VVSAWLYMDSLPLELLPQASSSSRIQMQAPSISLLMISLLDHPGQMTGLQMTGLRITPLHGLMTTSPSPLGMMLDGTYLHGKKLMPPHGKSMTSAPGMREKHSGGSVNHQTLLKQPLLLQHLFSMMMKKIGKPTQKIMTKLTTMKKMKNLTMSQPAIGVILRLKLLLPRIK